jgi:hypothetical protein
MRTTLDLDDDVLAAAKDIAVVRRTTLGKVVSELMRRAIEPQHAPALRNGVPLLARRPAGAPRPSLALVNRLRDES